VADLLKLMPAIPWRHHRTKKPQALGGEMRLGLTRGRGPLRRGLKGSPDSIRDSAAAAVALQCRQSGLMAGATSVSPIDQASTASVTQTPHSPQPYVRRSARPPVPGVWRVRCIGLPQFGQAGRAAMWSPTGRIKPCIANMIYLTAVRFQTTDLNSNACLRQ
jgi:hypothetical protein